MMSVLGANVYCRNRVPAGALTLTPTGGATPKIGSAWVRDVEVGGVARGQVGAGERLQPGRLRHRAGPRRGPAVEGEVVLPGEPAAPLGRRAGSSRPAAAPSPGTAWRPRCRGRRPCRTCPAPGAGSPAPGSTPTPAASRRTRPAARSRAAARSSTTAGWRPASANSAGSRDGVSWCDAAMSCMVSVTASSSVFRVPRSLLLRGQRVVVGADVGLVGRRRQRAGPVEPGEL